MKSFVLSADKSRLRVQWPAAVVGGGLAALPGDAVRARNKGKATTPSVLPTYNLLPTSDIPTAGSAA